MCFVFVLLFPHLYSCTTYRSTKNHCCNVLCQDKTRRSLCAEDPRGSQVLLRPRPRDDWGATNCTALRFYTELPLLHCTVDNIFAQLHCTAHLHCMHCCYWTALIALQIWHHCTFSAPRLLHCWHYLFNQLNCTAPLRCAAPATWYRYTISTKCTFTLVQRIVTTAQLAICYCTIAPMLWNCTTAYVDLLHWLQFVVLIHCWYHVICLTCIDLSIRMR